MGDFLDYSGPYALRAGFVMVVVTVIDTSANVEIHVVHEADPSSLPDPHNAFDQDVPKLAAVLQLFNHHSCNQNYLHKTRTSQ